MYFIHRECDDHNTHVHKLKMYINQKPECQERAESDMNVWLRRVIIY